MKKTFFSILCLGFSFFSYSQDNYFKYNGVADVLLRYQPNGSGGRALVHGGGNALVLNYGGDFTGGTEIQSNLRVTEMVKAKRLFLGPTSVTSGWGMTNLEYGGHTLRIGSPQGYSSHNVIEFVPGTNANALRYTVLNLCTSNTLDTYKSVIQLHTNGNSYINGGNVGIGTDNPQNKLDVNGDIGVHNLVLPGNKQITRNLSDVFSYKNISFGHYALGWMSDPWDNQGATLWQSGFGGIRFFTRGTYRMGIHSSGNVGIGTENPTQRLDVSGNIKADGAYINGIIYTNEVKVEATKWSDFVFDKDYKLPTLQEVENHINEHKHLPDIPSEAEVKENGVSLGEMQAKLLQKIEELTLYVIKQDKTIKEQGEKMNKQAELIKELQSKLE